MTARRVEEALQDVPMTVNVVTSKKLQDLSLFNGSDLVNVVPGCVFPPNIPGNTPVLSCCAAQHAAMRPAVRTLLSRLTSTNSRDDLRGWSTRHCMTSARSKSCAVRKARCADAPLAAGAITFTTNRPDLERFRGYVLLAASTLDQLRGEAAVSVPLVKDIFAVRFAGIMDRNDNDGTRSLFNGQKPYQHLWSWRGSLRSSPRMRLTST